MGAITAVLQNFFICTVISEVYSKHRNYEKERRNHMPLRITLLNYLKDIFNL